MKKLSYLIVLCVGLIGYTINAKTFSVTANIPANGTTTVNGVQVISSSSGSVNNVGFSNTVKIYFRPEQKEVIIISTEKLKGYRIYDGSGKLVISSSSLIGRLHHVDVSSVRTKFFVVSVETESQVVNQVIE